MRALWLVVLAVLCLSSGGEARADVGAETPAVQAEEAGVEEAAATPAEVTALQDDGGDGIIADGRTFVWVAYGVTWTVLILLTLGVIRGWNHRVREDESS